MPLVRAMPDDELDAWVEELEDEFTAAIRRAFSTTAKLIEQLAFTAAGPPGESFISLDDAQVATVVWRSEMSELTDQLHNVFQAGAFGLSNAIDSAVLPPSAHDASVDLEVVNHAALSHLAGAENRITALGDLAWDETRNSLLEGFKQGESIDELAARVRATADVAEARARVIARTETIMAANAGAYAQAQAQPDVVKPTVKEWLAFIDTRTRHSHIRANGQRVLIDDMFKVGGFSMKHPADPSGPAAEVVNCRCTTLYEIDEVECACPGAEALTAAAGDNTGTSAFRLAREKTGLSRAQMAKQLGWPMSKLWAYEVGKKFPTTADFNHMLAHPAFGEQLHVLGVHTVGDAKLTNAALAPMTQKLKEQAAGKKQPPKPDETVLGDCACKKTDAPGPTPGTTGDLDRTLDKLAKDTLKKEVLSPPGAPNANVLAPAPSLERRINAMNWRVDQYESSGLGGAHSKQVLRDDNGDLWLFKPQDDFRAELDVATARLQRLAGLEAPDTYVTTFGGRTGSVQRMFGTRRTRRDQFKGAFDPSKLTYREVQELQQHHAFDWLIGNHDGHSAQFLNYEKQMIAIDKGQAFKFFGTDKLDFTYNPNGQHIGNTVYNMMHSLLAEGRELKGFRFLGGRESNYSAFIRRLQRISDADIDNILRPYAEAAARRGFLARGSPFENDVEGFLRAVRRRRDNLANDLTRFHNDIKTRAAASRQVITPAETGDFQLLGMTGAHRFDSSDAAHAFHSRQPWAISRGQPGATQVRSYTGMGSGRVNPVLRGHRGGGESEQRLINGIDKAMRPITEDVILRRGTGSGWLPTQFQANPTTAIGRVFHARAYTSTSIHSRGGFGGQHLLNIRTRSSTTRGVYARPISSHPYEDELILARDSYFYVHDVRKKGTQWEFDIEVVSRQWAEAAGLIVR